MYAFFSGLANTLASQYNSSVGSTVLTPGVNLFIDDLPDSPTVAVVLLTDGALRNPLDITRRPEFEVAARAAAGRQGDASQMASRIYGLLDRKANLVTGFPCLVRAIVEPVDVAYDTQKRPIFISRFVLWGTNFS